MERYSGSDVKVNEAKAFAKIETCEVLAYNEYTGALTVKFRGKPVQFTAEPGLELGGKVKVKYTGEYGKNLSCHL